MSAATSERRLPPGFEDLEKYVAYWGEKTSQERWQRRSAASMEDIRIFYDAMLARAEDALAHLDQHDIDNLPEDAAQLSCLLFSLANCSMAIELHGMPRAPFSPFPHGVRVLKGAWPLG
jgi:hypothetical protein